MAGLYLCKTHKVPEGDARGFRLAGVNLLLTREAGQLHLFHNRCPHLGIPLEWEDDRFLDNEGNYIRCANHGALFIRHSGECIVGPCQGQYLLAIPFTTRDNDIYVAAEALRGLA